MPETQGNGPRRSQVAVIGTGLAGLTTAYLLHNDEKKQYAVTLFDQASALSFDGASVAVRNEKTSEIERIDLPMRASAGGYYANLMRMYDYLGIPLHPIRFFFAFVTALPSALLLSAGTCSDGERFEKMPGTYFIHASNLHQMPPPKPETRGFFLYVIEVLYLIVCHFWFSVACFWIPPITNRTSTAPYSNGKASTSAGDGAETLAQYVERIWLPRRYVSHYMLPLMSSVSTCSHTEMLAFPASDVVNYKKLSHGEQHYVVCGGIKQVQSKLAEGITNVRLGARVLQVCPKKAGGVTIRWQSVEDYDGVVHEQVFDRVVMAVSPDVVARIFSPLKTVLSEMPTCQVESSVVSRQIGRHSVVPDQPFAKGCSGLDDHRIPTQVITLRTLFSETDTLTEALHAVPSGVVVETCPLETDESKKKLHTAKFTRTLRTAQSRAVVQKIMGLEESSADIKGDRAEDSSWRSGQDNVWLAGAWCWDGMVLLEGCVVSAMRVAQDFGVSVPWQT